MTPIAQLIAELRDDVAELEGSAASGRKVVTDECVDRIRRAAEALARQEELIAEAGDSITPFANFAADNTVDDASGWAGGIWAGNRCERERIVDWFGPSDFRAAARLFEKLKDG